MIQGFSCALNTLELIFQDLRLNYQHFEDWHVGSWSKPEGKVSQRRSTRPDGPEPLDFLVTNHAYHVLAVDPHTGAALLDANVESFAGSWTLNGERISPVRSLDFGFVAANRTWCLSESDCIPVPGHTLRCAAVLVTDVPAIHATLLDFYRPRWQAMAGVPQDAWDRIVQFTQAFVPRGLIRAANFGLSDFCAAFRKGSALRTGGPDGWHKADILALPDCVFRDVINLYRHVEHECGWLQQLVGGHVFCLQKAKNVFESASYRPVVLFSIWYRLWSSMQSRHYFTQLERLANFPAFGFLTGRGCSDLTYAVQVPIAEALSQRRDLCGGLFDIEKRFNLYPGVR